MVKAKKRDTLKNHTSIFDLPKGTITGVEDSDRVAARMVKVSGRFFRTFPRMGFWEPGSWGVPKQHRAKLCLLPLESDAVPNDLDSPAGYGR